MKYNYITYLIIEWNDIEDVIKSIAYDAASSIRNDVDGIDNLEEHIKNSIESYIKDYLHKQW